MNTFTQLLRHSAGLAALMVLGAAFMLAVFGNGETVFADGCTVSKGVTHTAATITGGYRGLENRLCRVEIHEGGAIGSATFKWSRDKR